LAEEKAYPYTTVPNRLRELLGKLPSLGKPEKASQAWLKGLGYTSGNDRTMLAAMRKAGIIGPSGAPTDFYDAIRNKDGGMVAEGVRAAYRELFAVYPDAQQKDDEALRNFFRSKTSAGDDVQKLMVRTFKVFCERAEFGAAAPAATVDAEAADGNGRPEEQAVTRHVVRSTGGGLTLNVNIQLQLPPNAEGDVYEKLFEAMGKHLKSLASLE
jgi:hypothetical protein